jgi:hypothetical protein
VAAGPARHDRTARRERTTHGEDQFVGCDRLGQVVDRPEPQRAHGEIEFGAAGDEQQLQPGPVAKPVADVAPEPHAVQIRHDHVGDHDGDFGVTLDRCKRLPIGPGDHTIEAGLREHFAQARAFGGVHVDEEDFLRNQRHDP